MEEKINDELAKLAFPKSYRTNSISSILSFDFKIKCIDSSNRFRKNWKLQKCIYYENLFSSVSFKISIFIWIP